MPFLLLALVAAFALAASKGGGDSAPSASHPSTPWGPNHLPTGADVDAGLPPELLATIQSAIYYETSAAQLRNFAVAIKPYYPIAATILESRAAWLK